VRTLRGVAASQGASVAPAWLHEERELKLPDGPVDDRDGEIARLRESVAAVASALEAKSEASSGELAEVLDAQAMMARDPELVSIAEDDIRSHGTPAARAMVAAGESYATALERSESEYMAARAADVRDVCRRIARRSTGAPEADVAALSEPAVVVAAELPPAEVASLDGRLVKGIATEEGSRSSHTAIVARSLGIPAVVAIPGLLDAVDTGELVAIDGGRGELFVDPDDDTRARIEAVAEARSSRRKELVARRGGGPAATKDGERIEIAANVGGVAELRAALDEGAEGVGLLRTELLYLERDRPPDEDEQAALIAEMAALLEDRRLVVRTFDFGADKPVAFLDLATEANPALGVRGIRLARTHTELIETQLRAIVRAAEAGGRIAVMAPMVATAEEAAWFAAKVTDAGGRAAGVEIGAMIEVPSAVLAADALAERLDFFSIGTNDLTQYLHAADRQQGSLSYLQDPFSPALLRAVDQICTQAEGRAWVGVCGEAAGDPAWALLAVGLGVTELSMGTESLLEVGVALGEHTMQECRDAACAALGAPGAPQARRIAAELLS
jgi:phosphoenolpyruvate-protein phosphotransferase (PTS system enzyme I)